MTSRSAGAGRAGRAPKQSSPRLSLPSRSAPGTPHATPQAGSQATPQALLAVYRPDVSQFLAEGNFPAYRHAQVYEHLLRRPLQPFALATTLPGDLRTALDNLGVSTLALVESRTAPDETTKLLLSGSDGSCVETVIMRYRRRITACISSQVGCAVGCAFCATGGIGFRRNLSAAEIVDQVRAASDLAHGEGRRISNLVYMGMGEPLLNLRAVLDSIRLVTDPGGLGLAHRAVSVSTVGIPSGILRLGRAEPQVNLALSLHAADDRTRALLVPQRYRHPLPDILAAAWEHFAITRRKLLVEYVLLAGVNDSTDDARRLVGLLRGHVVAVNLLTWNSVPRSPFYASPPAAVAAFRDTLITAHIDAVVRQSKGSDIQAACGQLAARRRSCGDASRGG